MAAKARDEQEALAAKVAALEARVAELEGKTSKS
jgi:BMFP domain-containing protein YqiC